VLKIFRDQQGVPHVEASRKTDLYRGQGFVHATDRGLQMLLMRILSQGRLSELLDGSDAAFATDVFFRRMNWSAGLETQLALLEPEERACLEAYCEGASEAFANRYPWEFRLFGYRPEPWKPEDAIALSRMVGYLSMAQSQANMERLLVEMVRAGVERPKLEALFPGLLEGLDPELLRKLTLGRPVIPPEVAWLAAAAAPVSSNNWVLAGWRTASGKPLLANDPHLEGNRLPNIWQELVLRLDGRYAMGASMPGGPGIILGRNRSLAWGVTYSAMDAVDSWVERCRDGCCFRQPDRWEEFRQRRELILRRRRPPAEVTFYENEHGLLDGDPHQEGYYLATRWSAAESGGTTIRQFLRMWDADTVEEGMRTLGQVETAWNFVLADRQGNIGYQMSGRMPRRRPGATGLLPLPGWDPENDWQGFVSHEELPRDFNPASGVLITANNDLNPLGRAKPINLPVGPYRADRIRQLLEGRGGLTAEEMSAVQMDVTSLQAEAFMRILKPLLPDTPQGRLLGQWDGRYTPDSQAAFIFEEFYRALFREVFGAGGLGQEVAGYLLEQTGMTVAFFWLFDRVLLAETSPWFAGRTREALYRQTAAEALAVTPRPWGQSNRYVLRHILLGGKLPRFFGFDRGPVSIAGGRATIHQAQIFRHRGRTTSFVPSLRVVVDLAGDEIQSSLAGGPSDRRFSHWYACELADWLAGRYKRICLDPPQRRAFP
jgi:penicillin amidase